MIILSSEIRLNNDTLHDESFRLVDDDIVTSDIHLKLCIEDMRGYIERDLSINHLIISRLSHKNYSAKY